MSLSQSLVCSIHFLWATHALEQISTSKEYFNLSPVGAEQASLPGPSGEAGMNHQSLRMMSKCNYITPTSVLLAKHT